MRIVRFAFTFQSLLSLLLCIATVTVWVRSYRGLDGFAWERRDVNVYLDDGTGWLSLVDADMRGLISWRGGLWVGRGSDLIAGVKGNGWRRYTSQDLPPLDRFPYDRLHGGWNFSRLSRNDTSNLGGSALEGPAGYPYRGILLPHWAAVLVLAILPVIALKRRLVRRPTPGCCGVCGYDLRASRGRCPECGSPIAAESASRG